MDTEVRKLAAIMFTDMVGYSALAQRNEKLALELLEEHRRLLRTLFPRFHGTEIKTIGDAFLVEFQSALEAAQCGIEIQRTLAKRNADATADRRIEVKIGIHIGDVVHREGDVYGDGVNIASRIEPLAGAGGICISMDVERQIRSAIEVSLVKLAPTELKNIQAPMELFRVVLPWEKSAAEVSGRQAPGTAPVHEPRALGATSGGRPDPRRLGLGGAVLVFLAVGICAWWIWLRPDRPRTAASTPGRITSLAVKPLDDFSGDTNQAYLSDGMTEALCSALGNISALRVPGRSSAMHFKGTQKTIQMMAKELNVDAIVEGSIQRAGNRILVTAQLIEAAEDRHLWATNYERDLSDFFKVQSEVARAIAAEIRVRLTPEDQARLARARTANPQVIEACLMGMHYYWQFSDEGATNALRHFRRAIEIDPTYAPAHAGAALAYGAAGWWGFWPPREAMPKAKMAAQRAIELDPAFPDGHIAMGFVKLDYDWDWPGAERAFKRALELSPNSSEAMDGYITFLCARGRFDEAVVMLKKALELDPVSPAFYTDLGWVYQYSGQFEQALAALRKALELDHSFFWAHNLLGITYQLMGKTAEALAEFQTMIQLAPDQPYALSSLGGSLGEAGRRAEALKALADLDQLATKRYVTRTAQAGVYLAMGQKETALDWLEKAYEERDIEMPYLKVDPTLAPLRNEPRFQALLKKVGLDK